MGILAEVCVPEILPHINNPDNHKFPLSRFPSEMASELAAGRPYGGPVHQVLQSRPTLLEAFLNQRNPLLSFELFPIFDRDRWWGSIGFDDCDEPRSWHEQEVVILRTAAEMIGNTVQRWQAEEHLHETLSRLEERVKERTIEIAQTNTDLREEIQERKRFQDELEERLEIERTLANISVRLLSPMDLIPAIQKTLEDVGRIAGADRVVFNQLSHRLNNTVAELIEWHAPDIPPIHENLARYLDITYQWFRHHFEGSRSIYIQDLSNIPDGSQSDKETFNADGINSLLLIPVLLDDNLAGVIACSNPQLPIFKSSENIHTTEVIASMLSGLLYREMLLNTLEEKVAERTRELSAFFDMAILAGEAEELSDIMQSALVKIMETSASEAAVIHLYDEDQKVMRLNAQRGLSRDVLAQLQKIHLDEAMMSWIKDGGDDILLPDAALLPAAFEIPLFLSASHIALRARGKLQGLLSCYRLSDRPFSHYQEVFLNAICEQLGMAVENHRLRLKAEEVATIQERQRLARELHDAVSQSIYSLTLFARSGRDALDAGDRAKLQDSLAQIETNSQIALKEMRLLLYQLRSLALTEGGLVQAIESRFGLVERRLGIQASIHIDESLEFDTEAEQELFRLLTEALNNVLKHAAASQVSVSMLSENDHIALVVSDNGSGFDPAGAFDGMGLQNIRDRVSALGGRMDISSQPELGTRLRVELPRLSVSPGEGE
jgi:signal transduction histidine kinase